MRCRTSSLRSCKPTTSRGRSTRKEPGPLFIGGSSSPPWGVLLAETWLANERSSELGRALFSTLRRGTKPAGQPVRELAKL